ncbi:MAG: hypothetical protein IE926_05755 [Micrococcales bacterium]|nr:hypothetical protein [Micrococcales bacterium]
MKGRPFLPWQQLAADVALEYDPATGVNRFGIIVLTVQRQAGKTTLVGVLADRTCLSRPGGRAWITMQNGKTADAWMRNEHLPSLLPFGDPENHPRKSGYRRSLRAGEIGPIWKGVHSTFFTFPPKHDALHSKQGDLIIVSEAWAIAPDQGAAIRQAARPTMSTRRNAQLVVESTRGDDSSLWFDGYYDLGVASLADPTSRVCFIDYGIEDDADAEDLDVIAAAHPAYGLTIDRQALVDAREEFRASPSGDDVAGWARAYGNRASRTRETAIPAAVWQAAGRAQIAKPARAGLALDVTPGGDRAALAAGWRAERDNHELEVRAGDAFVELLHADRATREFPALVARVAEARRVPVLADRASVGAMEVMDALARNHPRVEQHITTMSEYAAACVGWERGIRENTIHHFNDPDLDAAVALLTKRDLGDGAFGWGRKGAAGSIAEAVAATLAVRAFDTLPRRRSARVLTATPSVTTS